MIKAVRAESLDKLRAENVPGSFFIENDPDFGLYFLYRCPCGCGHVGELSMGKGEKPAESPSWKWDGNDDAPTLHPSVNHINHWHGWLQDGVWRPA